MQITEPASERVPVPAGFAPAAPTTDPVAQVGFTAPVGAPVSGPVDAPGRFCTGCGQEADGAFCAPCGTKAG